VNERLAASDMASLVAERGPIHVHVGATIIVEGAPPELEWLLDHVERRLELVPRFRQHVRREAFNLLNPRWADGRFDARWHVRHTALPRPGSMAQLRDLVGWVMSEPLDFTRPLWQLYLIEGLEGGRHAYVSKTHHALVDGLAAVDVGTIILDASPEASDDATLAPEPAEADAPSPEMLIARASGRLQERLRAARKGALEAISMPRSTASRVLQTAESFTSLAARGPSAPHTFLNREIGRDRRVAFVATELEALKHARGRSPATVNDVILSVTAGALRRGFARRGEEIPRHLVALVPVSIRRPGEDLELGNRIATILVPLPVREIDPVRRLGQVNAHTARLKASEQTRATSLIIEATGWTPPTINRVLADALARPLSWNLVVSNVPGPQVPLYLLGRRLEAIYPFVPLSPQRHALSVGVLSYDGGAFFGLTGDRDLLAVLDQLAADLEAALAEQLDAAE
jgi:diacylglycerol O-acyltransferase / wax synthase